MTAEQVIASAASHLYSWACEQVRMRGIVRLPYAVIDGQVQPLDVVVYHCPEALR